jgi:hypothetical protein
MNRTRATDAQFAALTCVVADNLPVVAVTTAVSLEVQYGISWWSIPTIHKLERLSSLIWNRMIM